MTWCSLTLCWHFVSLTPFLITVSLYHISEEDAQKSKSVFSAHEWCKLPSSHWRCFTLVTVGFVWRSVRSISLDLLEILVSFERKQTCIQKKILSGLLFSSMSVETVIFVTCRWKATTRIVINKGNYLEGAFVLCMFWCIALPADVRSFIVYGGWLNS